MKLSCAALLAVVFAIASPQFLFAQNANDQNSLLPEIDPQDIEIRSEFRARFPGLRRQPILGFNPRPRVFQIDPNRLPFMETADQVVANLPVSQLSRPVPPIQPSIYKPNRSFGFVRTGIGSFTAPELVAFATAGVDENNLVSASIDYRSSDDHLDNQQTSFRFLNANLDWVGKLRSDMILNGSFSLDNDFNFVPGEFAFRPPNSPRKDLLNLNPSLSIKKFRNRLEYWEASFDYRITAIDIEAETPVLANRPVLGRPDNQVNEQLINLKFKNHWAGNNLFETYSLFSDLKLGQYDITDFENTALVNTTLVNVKAGADYQRILDTGTQINAKAAIQFIDDGIDGNIYIAPELRLKQTFQEKVLIEATAFGRPELLTILDHHRINRMLDFNGSLKQTYTISATGKATLNISDFFQLYGGLSYSFINNYNFYRAQGQTSESTPDVVAIWYDIGNADASIFKLYTGIAHEIIPEKMWFSAEAYARSPRFTAGGDIPFEERLGLTGTLSLRPIKSVLLETWVDYIGERDNPNIVTELSGFLLVNVKAEVEIAKNFGAYIKSLNLLDSEYQIWQGYTERPFQLFAGITYKF